MKCRDGNELTCRDYPHCYGCNAAEGATNADRIRAMSDEELARFIRMELDECPKELSWDECTSTSCVVCWTEWLRQPAEGGEQR